MSDETSVLGQARTAGWTRASLLRELRAKRAWLSPLFTPPGSHSTWLRAIRAVAGCGVRDLHGAPNPLQQALPFVGWT